MSWWLWVLFAVLTVLTGVTIYDLTQTKHAILRNYPIVGHLRFLLESVGPELRQYIVTDNDEERPFTRDQRRYIYTTAKRENPYFGFGTDNDLDVAGYELLRHASFPHPSPPDHLADDLPMKKVLGGLHDRVRAFTPASIVNISAMSFGSLSAPAIEALNRGAKIANCMHNTGEGGISDHHRHGGLLTFQLGTGYFGARNPDGTFSMERLLESLANTNVGAIEIKLSQGAKPGLGGVLPAAKVTVEIARTRGVEVGVSVRSPATHSSFSSVPQLIQFVEQIAAETGMPVGIKSAVGERRFWTELASEMRSTRRGPDFITVDGGEGGTGAAPLSFSDHVSLPFRQAFAEVYQTFAAVGLDRDLIFVGAGKLGLPTNAIVAMGMGADGVNVGREAMFAAGCIQAQRCHTGRCPTGVATHNAWLTRGLDPTDKSVRVANYIAGFRRELRTLANAMGVDHPCDIDPSMIEIRVDANRNVPVRELYGYADSAR